MTKRLFLNTLLIAVCFQFVLAENPYDFEKNGIRYSITSDTTVKVSGQNYWNNFYSEYDDYFSYASVDIEIPIKVQYNNKNYTVTEIGDSAFYCSCYYSNYVNVDLCFNITIPETVTSVGFKAFGGLGPNCIVCFSKNPPFSYDSFDLYGNGIKLFVLADAFSIYKEYNDQYHCFDSVYITDGERSQLPSFNEEYLYQPVGYGYPYGYAIEIFQCENSTLCARWIYNISGMHDYVTSHPWSNYYTENAYFYFESINQGLGCSSGSEIEFYTIEEGKSPSYIISSGCIGGDEKVGCFDFKWTEAFDFSDHNLYYNDLGGAAEVTFGGYIYAGCGEKGMNIKNKSIKNGLDYYPYDYIDEFDYYSGDVVIPSTTTYHNYHNNTDTLLPVTSISYSAFKDCVNLNSITIPSSITTIHEGAFERCDGLTRVNITDLEAWCKIIFLEFGNRSTNPLACAHHLYLNGSEVTDLIIPNSVTTINWCAFEGCSGLTSVTIPSTVTDIGLYSFWNCPNLTSIRCLGKIPPTPDECDDIFFDESVYQNATLYVPFDVVEAYRNAPVWCKFQNIVGFYDYDFETDGLYFKVTNEGEVVLTAGSQPYSGSVMVPTEVTFDGVTYAVTGIVNGTFANAELSNLYLPVTIGNIGEGAFAGCNIQSLYITGASSWQAGALNLQVNNLFIDSGVTGLAGMQVDASSIYCYATVPPACDDQTFQSYNADLHVPASSLAAYFTAPYWCNFLNIIGDAVELTEFTLSDSSLEMPVGGQATLRVTIKPTNATAAEVTWSSDNDAVATVTGGVVTGIAAGECDIIAISQSQRAVCHVVVYDIPATGITISQETAKMEMGTQLTLTATVLPEDATDKTVTWLSDNEAVATVADGVVSAVGTGQCDITAYCGEFQATCHVIVVEHLVYITLDKHEVDLLPNHILTLTPTVSPVSTDLAVTSANPNVAAVRLAGNRIQVVGIAEGTTTIYVNSADGYAEGDSCEVTVITEIGDVNNDGYVDINDVTILIDRMLGKNQPINFENADVNYDGTIDINDITELIGFLLGVSQLEPKDHHIVPYTVNGVTFKMVRVTGGTFMMGATPEQGENTSDKEKPVHQVTLSSFSISQTEVTQELWDAVMGTNPSYYTGDMQCPVESVSWNDCQAFIAQLNQLTGEQFRLPTEAEWEFAARGGNKSQGTRYAGSNIIDDVAWYNANSTNTTHPVALKTPNELGLFDMTGNVWEWCNDWYKRYTAEAQTDPTGPETGNNRVLRGGCWNGDTNYNRISYRDNFTPTGSNSSGGLRLAL